MYSIPSSLCVVFFSVVFVCLCMRFISSFRHARARVRSRGEEITSGRHARLVASIHIQASFLRKLCVVLIASFWQRVHTFPDVGAGGCPGLSEIWLRNEGNEESEQNAAALKKLKVVRAGATQRCCYFALAHCVHDYAVQSTKKLAPQTKNNTKKTSKC